MGRRWVGARGAPGLGAIALCALICGLGACSETTTTATAVACPDGGGADGAADDGAMSDGAMADGGTSDGGNNPGKRSATDRLFDGDAPLRTIDLQVADADWTWLRAHAVEETYVPAVVSSAGQPTTTAGVRFKGAYGSLFSCFDKAGKQTCDKLSMKVSFNETFSKGRMFGVRKLVLNACNRDPTCLRERLTYRLFADAGIVAPRSVHVLVRVNGGPPSLYLLVENVDKEFLEDHFAVSGGDLFKEVWPGNDDKAAKDGLKTNKKSADLKRLHAFAKVLAGADASHFAATVDPWIDRAAMTRYFVVDQLSNNWDGIWKFYCPDANHCRNHNYYLYDDPGSGRFVVIPWDLDHTFTTPNADMGQAWLDDGPDVCKLDTSNPLISTRAPQCDPLLRGLMRSGWQDYVALVDSWTRPGARLDVPTIHALLDTWRAQIHDAVADDPLGPGLVQWLSATAQLRQLIVEQHTLARALK